MPPPPDHHGEAEYVIESVVGARVTAQLLAAQDRVEEHGRHPAAGRRAFRARRFLPVFGPKRALRGSDKLASIIE
jgi:hypothetical protein